MLNRVCITLLLFEALSIAAAILYDLRMALLLLLFTSLRLRFFRHADVALTAAIGAATIPADLTALNDNDTERQELKTLDDMTRHWSDCRQYQLLLSDFMDTQPTQSSAKKNPQRS